MSLPVWECGLKWFYARYELVDDDVTPCVGVWIEIVWTLGHLPVQYVTPCVGVWIEMQ